MALQETIRKAFDSGHTLTLEERQDPEVRRSLSAAILRVFFQIAGEWSLTVGQRRILLGGIAASTYHKWNAGSVGALSYDQIERISLVLGVYKGMKLLFADDAAGLRWFMAANHEIVFGGQSPLRRMLQGSIDDLYAVRRYIDAWRG